MAFKEFTLEGEAIFRYYGSEVRDREVRMVTAGENPEGVGEALEAIVARSLGFPSDEEFESMMDQQRSLAEQELQPADGAPDIVRRGMRLKIEVEVMDE